jgi:small subunit ribosomal protein S11
MTDEATIEPKDNTKSAVPAMKSDTESKPTAKGATTETKTSKTKPAFRSKKKVRKFINKAVVHVLATYNNTIITFTDPEGNVLASSSAGQNGFKGPKKSTPYAAGIIVRSVVDRVRDFGIKEVDVRIKGVGSGREAAVRALNAQGYTILSIRDVSPIPHNGPRPRKVRRV